MRSDFANALANNIVGYQVLLKIKADFQQRSRESQKNYREEVERERFKKISAKLREEYQQVLLGHSHIYSEENGYYNNGFFPAEKKFFHYQSGVVKGISLN